MQDEGFRRSFWKRFLLFWVLSGLLVFGLMAVVFRMETGYLLEKSQLQENLHLDIYRNQIETQLEQISSDIKWLAVQNELQEWLDTGSRPALRGIADEYLALSRSRGLYDQIRFLDQDGQEIVRVNFNAGQPEIVPDAALQNKGQRYYFQDAWKLDRDDVFVSPLDLNIEGGQIETPYKPMIRFATPVFDHAGKKRGIVLLNYLAGGMLEVLKNAASGGEGAFMLLNSDAFWLAAADPGDEWGFMFADRRDRRFSERFPTAWARISSSEAGQFRDSEGLFTFVSVHPFGGEVRSSSGSGSAFAPSEKTLAGDRYQWKMVSFISTDLLLQPQQRLRYSLLWLCSLVAILLTGLCLLMALVSVRRKAYQHALYELAMVDSLTGIGNRKTFEDRLEYVFQQAFRYQTRMEILMIDLDGFKEVNDTFGHHTGDALLQEVARRLTECIRQADTAARMGGDEFAVILSQVSSAESGEMVAERILTRLRQPFSLNNRNLKISASIGASVFPGTAKNPDELLKQADKAMYAAKNAGKNCFRQ